MNVEHAPRASTESRERHSSARVPGQWLLLARGTWFTLVVLTLAIFGGSLPLYLAQLHTPCAGSACGFQQLTPQQAGALTGMGLSLGDYTVFTVALTFASVVVCVVVSTVIVLRRSDDRMALLVALMLVTIGPLAVSESVSASPSPWQVPNEWMSFLLVALLFLVFSLFPSGQFVPHWMRWPIAVFLAGHIPLSFFPVVSTLRISALSLGYLMFLGVSAILVVAQVYRYRHRSTTVQRQQTKWVVFGFAVPITVYVIGIVPYLLFSVLAAPGSLYLSAFIAVQDFLFLLIPLSFGFAMLRNRLWDIDILIRRTLVYATLTGVLTGILALVYLGSIFLLQSFFHGIIHQGYEVAIVLSTLVIYALFQPVRLRLQAIIDRRFYRRKYNAARTLAAFSATLRHEVDLDDLSRQLVAVVQETIQPEHVSLWVRPLEHDGTPRTPWRATPPVSSTGR